jgi:glycosyltransferase involved in cell wall biosynthesis
MVNAKPLVSVAIATYNGEKYIGEQLNSILNQTYTNIEIVITDDNSADNTVSIIKAFQQKHISIVLFIKEKNSGVTETFENSIKNCKGEFIALSDQDDIWQLDKIEILVNEMGNEDAVYSNSLLVDKNGMSLTKEFKSIMNLKSYYSGAPFLLSNCVPGHTILMKSGFAKMILPFPRNIMFDRWISFCAAANNGIKFVDKPLVLYRQHDTNTIGVGKFKNRRHRETSSEKFTKKFEELITFARAPIKDEETKGILQQMIKLFNHSWSIKRSRFFFKNLEKILVVKKKSHFRKILYCIKMFFKPNY